MSNSLFFEEVRRVTSPSTRIIFLVGKSNDINSDVVFTMDYLFNNQFSTIFNNSEIREDSSLIVSSSFGEKLYLSTIINKEISEIKKEIENTLPIAQLKEDAEILIIHSLKDDYKRLEKTLKGTKINSINF